MSLKKHILKTFELKKEKNWKYIYIAIDIHGTILKPCHKEKENYEYFPYAKETLQFISNMDDIKLILFTSSHEKNIKDYIAHFQNDNIHFCYINENKDVDSDEIGCYDKKFYTDIGIDDKFGFDANTEWLELFELFKTRIK